MSSKDTIEKLRKKYHDKQKELIETKAKKEVEEKLNSVVYDVYQDPTKRSRSFIMVKLCYDLDTGVAKVVEKRRFEDKAAGLSFVLNKDNLEYLFNKCKKGEKI